MDTPKNQAADFHRNRNIRLLRLFVIFSRYQLFLTQNYKKCKRQLNFNKKEDFTQLTGENLF